MKSQTIHTNGMTLQPFSGRLANATTHNLTSAARLSADATTLDHKEVTMKTQISKQHTNVVAVQPLTTAHKEDCMKNAHRIHFEFQSAASQTTASRGISLHRLNTMFAVAMSVLLLGLICSAQTNTYIPQLYFWARHHRLDNESTKHQPNQRQQREPQSYQQASTYDIGGYVVLAGGGPYQGGTP